MRVSGCSDVIKSGKADGGNLARAHYNRGNAYLAKAALRMGDKQRATEFLGLVKATGESHPLVQRLVTELEPELQSADVVSQKRLE